MTDKWICMKQCYYLTKLWSVGEVLPEGSEPNKHFALNGVEPATEEPIVRAGDDPRSTVQIRKDLETKHGAVGIPEDATRKELFNAWVKAEKEASEGVKTKTPEMPGTTEVNKADLPPGSMAPDEPDVAVSKEKKFSDMTPDEFDQLKHKDIAEKITRLYKKEIKYVGAKKATLIKQALAIEDAWVKRHVGAMSP